MRDTNTMRKRTIIICLFILFGLGDKSNAAGSLPAAQLARQQANCGEWQQAIESYNKALNTSPNDAVCLARRGFAYANLGNFKQAFVDFTSSLEHDPHCSDAYSRRARVYAWLGLDQLAQQDASKALKLITSLPKEPDLLLEHAGLLYTIKNTQEADEESKQVLALKLQSKDVGSLIITAGAHANLHQYKDSVNCLSQALKLSPDCFELYYLRSARYGNLNQWKLGLADSNRYMTYNHKNPLAFSQTGSCYYCNGDYAKAISEYDQAIKLAPNFVYAFYWRGRAHHDLKDYLLAICDYSTAINLDPTTAYNYEDRADSYCHQKAWEKALQDTKQTLLLDPHFMRAYHTQAWAHDESGHFAEAIEDDGKAIALGPKDPSLYFSRGMRYRDHKQYKKAIADITEAIKYDQKNAIYFCARGSALVSDHQYDQAIADCTQSLNLNALRTHPHLSRGIAYAKQGHYTRALWDIDEAIRQYPKYGEAYFERSLIDKSLGNKYQYEKDLQKAQEFGYQSPEAM
jgi:tetratricopeptide (TPR) repeat protein